MPGGMPFYRFKKTATAAINISAFRKQNNIGFFMLNLKNVTVKFGGLTAVKDMTFEIEKQTIHSLIGPNGAGKTTIFNAITGVVQTANGDVTYKDKSLLGYKQDQIIFQGIARTFQNLQLFNLMTVYENLYSGYVHLYQKNFFSVFFNGHKKFDKEEAAGKIMEVADLLQIKDKLNSFPAQLSYGILKRVELARALISDPEVLLFDEPAAGLTNEDTSEIIDIFKLLNSKGKTLLIVEHDMNMVMNVSDKITVMDFGEKIAEGTPKEIANNPEVIKVYLGESQDN
jgi:branched-chain amino acid transport system ATP-binding protein